MARNKLTDTILESISDGVFTVGPDWRITSFNRAAEEITGVPRSMALGQRCSDVFRSSMCGEDCPLKQTMKKGTPVIGISGYIINADGARIPISISTAVLKDTLGNIIGGAETFRDLSELEALREQLGEKTRVGDLISWSPLMHRLFEVLPVIAASPSTVLILGETGTGKEVMARTIHNLSPRSEGPFIAVNCGALPDSLLESELFGYKSGAFTGADKDKPGRFALANGGSIFIDEIGELSLAVQVKLLRVLQEHVYEPLGANHPESTDVRVIVATNCDLSEMVRQKQFREDLYYRINVIRVELPPLRSRKEDIPLLVEQFIESFNRLRQHNVQGIAVEALSLLMAHHWPGNIRELENAIERAFVLCREGEIGLQHLPEELTNTRHALQGTDIRSAHDILNIQMIQTVLERCRYNKAEAARELGIHRTTLFRRIRKLGITVPTRSPHS